MTDPIRNLLITPPPELVKQWLVEGHHQDYCSATNHAIAQAARWGADQELWACCELLDINGCPSTWIDMLRAARRPKPPSLAEEALGALEQIDGWAVSNMNHLSIHDDLVTGVEAIRTALERLKELEGTNG